MMFRLIILSGPRKGQRMAVEAGGVSVGRDPTCSLVLEDQDIGGQHAMVEPEGDHLILRDLNSSGKTRVNSEVVEKARLRHGDVVEIGETRLFVEALRPAGIGGAHSIWLLNRILTITALIALPIAFLYTVALLERKYLGIGVPTPVAAAPTASPTKSELNLPGTTNSLAARTPGRSGETSDAAGLTPRGVSKELAELAAAEKPLPGASGMATAAARLLTNREETGMIDLAIKGTSQVEDVKKPAAVVKAIRIAAVDESKLPEDDELDEIRLLEVRLTSEPGPQRRTPESVQVDVSLFDKQVKTGDIVLTHARVTTGPLQPEGAWKGDEQKTVRVTYAVPKGTRITASDPGGVDRYFGYRVRVYYHGQLQDEKARPLMLLDYSADRGSDAAGRDNW